MSTPSTTTCVASKSASKERRRECWLPLAQRGGGLTVRTTLRCISASPRTPRPDCRSSVVGPMCTHFRRGVAAVYCNCNCINVLMELLHHSTTHCRLTKRSRMQLLLGRFALHAVKCQRAYRGASQPAHITSPTDRRARRTHITRHTTRHTAPRTTPQTMAHPINIEF